MLLALNTVKNMQTITTNIGTEIGGIALAVSCAQEQIHTILTILCTLFYDSLSHVILPKDLAKTLNKSRLLTENEWRSIGVQQSRGWQHYAIHR